MLLKLNFGEYTLPNTQINITNNKTFNDLKFILYSLLYSENDSLTKFKFTGPISIGKTVFLLRFCHSCPNAFYINLKVLSKEKVEKGYSIIQEEFSRLKEYFDEVQSIINNNYKKEQKPIESIVELIDYFSKIGLNFLFVFDQFKNKYLKIKENIKLDNLKSNIKFVYCSSINDKENHDECTKTWKGNGLNPTEFNNENQKYYFYYSKIFELPKKTKCKKIIDKFNGINRYTDLFRNNTKDDAIKLINEKIIKKIKEFSKGLNCSLDYILINIKNIVKRKYGLDNLLKITEYCPLKYLVVKFLNDDSFTLKYRFPFLKYIVERQLTESEINSFFGKKNI